MSDQLNPYKYNPEEEREYICNYDYLTFNAQMSEEFEELHKITAEELYERFQNFMKNESIKVSNDSFDEVMMRPQNTLKRMKFEFRKEMFKYLLNKSRMKLQIYKSDYKSNKKCLTLKPESYDIKNCALDSLKDFSNRLSKKVNSEYQPLSKISDRRTRSRSNLTKNSTRSLKNDQKHLEKYQIWESRWNRLLIRQALEEDDNWEQDIANLPPKRFAKEIKHNFGSLLWIDIDDTDFSLNKNNIKFEEEWSIKFDAEESMGDYTFD